MGKKDPQHNIDLGKLQDDYDKARTNLKKARTLLDNAQQQFDAANLAFGKAYHLLKESSRTVLTS